MQIKEMHLNDSLSIDEKIRVLRSQGYIVPNKNLIKNKEEIEAIKKSAEINNALLDFIAENICEGMSTQDIDDLVKSFTNERGAICAPFHYDGYPKNVCTSINDVVCHGIPSKKEILKNGDIINVDVSTIYKGYFSDASRMFCIGNVSKEYLKLVEVSKECLEKGIEAAKPWGFVGDISEAICEHAFKHGYSVVREFGGHGIGLQFHEDPFIAHVGKKGTGMVLVPGMIFTIEPMINMGGPRVFVSKKDHWTVRTRDRLPSAQWEHMILITETGIEILSK